MRRECAAQKQQTWAVTVKGNDTVIGLVSLQYCNHRGDRYHRRAEVGYGIARASWGQGIGPEAVRAVVHYGFEHLKLNRIYAGTIADNLASVRLLEKLGFVREGTRRQHSLEDDGLFHDSALYGLIRSDWKYDRG
jgi:ribosomal-protein-alanine N-acetyltransferase